MCSVIGTNDWPETYADLESPVSSLGHWGHMSSSLAPDPLQWSDVTLDRWMRARMGYECSVSGSRAWASTRLQTQMHHSGYYPPSLGLQSKMHSESQVGWLLSHSSWIRQWDCLFTDLSHSSWINPFTQRLSSGKTQVPPPCQCLDSCYLSYSE